MRSEHRCQIVDAFLSVEFHIDDMQADHQVVDHQAGDGMVADLI